MYFTIDIQITTLTDKLRKTLSSSDIHTIQWYKNIVPEYIKGAFFGIMNGLIQSKCME